MLLGSLARLGWLEFLSLQIAIFKEIELLIDSSDRMVWRTAQERQACFLKTRQ